MNQNSRLPQQTTVESVDLNRYMGKWYEIAALPNSFQKNCFCSAAEYRLKDDYVEVINTCRKNSPAGPVDRIKGKAWPVSGSGGAKLKVQFFWPFKGDYWIIALDKNYEWVMVGHPDRDYLWILSRRPELDTRIYQELIEKAANFGYAVEKVKLADPSCP